MTCQVTYGTKKPETIGPKLRYDLVWNKLEPVGPSAQRKKDSEEEREEREAARVEPRERQACRSGEGREG